MMSKASGFVLLSAGLAAGVYLVLPSSDTPFELDLPQHIGLTRDTARPSDASQPGTQAIPQPAFRRVAAPKAKEAIAEPIPPFSAPVVVTLAQRAAEQPAVAATTSHKALPMPRDRDSLTRELQKELKRVGCYDGEINGVWTPSSRAAMKAFTDRINATLPLDEPDSILFTLLQGQQDRVCGKPCPAGQGLSQDGRCLPNAILAHAARKGVLQPTQGATLPKASPSTDKPTPAITAWSTTTVAATPPSAVLPPAEGRMALAGPNAEETAPAATPSPATTAPPAVKPAAATPRPTPRVSQGNGWASSVLRSNMSPN